MHRRYGCDFSVMQLYVREPQLLIHHRNAFPKRLHVILDRLFADKIFFSNLMPVKILCLIEIMHVLRD